MTGREYLEDIRAKLDSGRHQSRMGENVLRAFGYVRRRATAIEEINATLKQLGLVAYPPVSSDMPLKAPRIRFSLQTANGTELPETELPETDEAPDTSVHSGFASPLEEADDNDSSLPEPAFSVSELASANTDVECVSPSASIQTAYTTMLLRKFSQLVVADHATPMQQDIKGIVSFQSMTKALMNGKPTTVGDCIDNEICFAQSDADLTAVVSQLNGNDVVLVIGRDKRLQGIVTAWDLAEEFAEMVDPFKRIGEIEERLRTLIRMRLGKDKVTEFLRDRGLLGNDPIAEIEELTMGGLQRVLEFPEHWDELELAFDRVVFIDALGEARGYRNRLMHFRDPLTRTEMMRLSNFCDTVREIQLYRPYTSYENSLSPAAFPLSGRDEGNSSA
jgi:CBS domain-containing protein